MHVPELLRLGAQIEVDGNMVKVKGKPRSLAGAPVMDVFAVTWAYALMQIRLWSKAGLRVGRSWHHRRDDPAVVARFFRGEV